jgi:predicted Zn-dependent protease
MSARARVLMDTSVVALRRLQELPTVRAGQGAPERLAALYASALASSLLRDHAQAEQRGRQARALLAEQAAPEPAIVRALWLLDAEARMAAGDVAGALQRVAELRERWPDAQAQRPLLMLQAQAALQLAAPAREAALRQATESLQTWVAAHPQDATAWLLLGNTAEALGLRLRALRAHAESRLLVGDLTGAMDRLRSGRKLARGSAAGQDFIEASIIDARLRELEARRRALIAERGGRVADRAGDRPERDDGDAPPR